MRSTRFQPPMSRLMPLGVCTLTLWLTLTAIATAEYKPPSEPSAPRQGTTTTKGPRAYNPPTRPSSPRRGTTTTGGTRGGCQGNSPIPLTLLAPVDHVGQSHTTHPTVAWFVPPGTSQPVRLRLFEATAMGRGTQLYETELSPTPGVMTQTLPADQPGLTPGRQYIWQVTLLCDRNRPSQNLWLETAIAVEPLPAGLQAQLASTPDRLTQAQIYAGAGFWYDALALTLAPATVHDRDPDNSLVITGRGGLPAHPGVLPMPSPSPSGMPGIKPSFRKTIGGARLDQKSMSVNPLGITLLQDLSAVESTAQQQQLGAIVEYLQSRP